MLVSELIQTLQQRLAAHGDREVKTTWEGIYTGLSPQHVYLGKNTSLIIDADDCHYKRDFAVDPNEGKP